MTGFLASVASLPEARIVHATGVDVIDLKNPARGALGAVEPAVARVVAAALPPREGAGDGPGAPVLSAAIGDLPVYAAELEAAVARMDFRCLWISSSIQWKHIWLSLKLHSPKR